MDKLKKGFVNELSVVATKPGKWMLIHALYYRAKNGDKMVVPGGFETDLASIPRLLRWLFNQNGESRKAAVLHDWLYVAQMTSRKEADELFLEALELSGVGWVTRQSMYMGVRMGGWVYWNKRAPQD